MRREWICMCTHLILISKLTSTNPSRFRVRTTRQTMASGKRQRLVTAMRSGIDLHVHSPNFTLHADLHQSVSVQRAHNQAGNGIRLTAETSYSNENGIDLHVHSPNFNHHADLQQSVSVQRAHKQKDNGIRISAETRCSNEKWNRFACALT